MQGISFHVLSIVLLFACSSGAGGNAPKVEISDTKVSVNAPDPKPEIDPARADKFRASVIHSMLTATVINNGDTPVKGSLDLARGAVDFSGASPGATVVLDVTSWNSDLLLRDDRMRQIFFKTADPGRDVMTLTLNAIEPDVITRLQTVTPIRQGARLAPRQAAHCRRSKLRPICPDNSSATDKCCRQRMKRMRRVCLRLEERFGHARKRTSLSKSRDLVSWQEDS